MRDNTVKDYDGNGLDIYEHKIYVLADDYINTVLLISRRIYVKSNALEG